MTLVVCLASVFEVFEFLFVGAAAPWRHCGARHHEHGITGGEGEGGVSWGREKGGGGGGGERGGSRSGGGGLHKQQVMRHKAAQVVLPHVHVHCSNKVAAGAVATHQNPEGSVSLMQLQAVQQNTNRQWFQKLKHATNGAPTHLSPVHPNAAAFCSTHAQACMH